MGVRVRGGARQEWAWVRTIISTTQMPKCSFHMVCRPTSLLTMASRISPYGAFTRNSTACCEPLAPHPSQRRHTRQCLCTAARTSSPSVRAKARSASTRPSSSGPRQLPTRRSLTSLKRGEAERVVGEQGAAGVLGQQSPRRRRRRAIAHHHATLGGPGSGVRGPSRAGTGPRRQQRGRAIPVRPDRRQPAMLRSTSSTRCGIAANTRL